MGRLRLAGVECDYRKVDRQLKEQFVHRLNDNYTLAEIIKELVEKSADITSEKVLGWAKRVEDQRTQSAIMESLTETKEFDKVKIAEGEHYSYTNSLSLHPLPFTKTLLLAKALKLSMANVSHVFKHQGICMHFTSRSQYWQVKTK